MPRHSRWLLASALIAALASPVLVASAAAAAREGGASVSDLSWLAGCWTRSFRGRLVEEQWMAPRGGMMLGVSRTTAGDSTVEFEHTRIEEAGGRLVFTARPSGQPEASFTAIEVSSRRVVFENRSHDFPQRIIYARSEGDTLRARIEGLRGGVARGVDFPMARVDCPDGAAAATGSEDRTRRIAAELTRQADEWDRAIVRKDSLAIAANMADDFRQISRDGSVSDRATFLREIVDPKLTIDPYTVEDLDVRLYGDVALLCGRTRMTGRYDGKAFASHNRYTDVYVREGGAWKVCSVHITAVAD